MLNAVSQLMFLSSPHLAPLPLEQCQSYLNGVSHLKEHNLENSLQMPPDFCGDSQYCQDDGSCQPPWLHTTVCAQGVMASADNERL